MNKFTKKLREMFNRNVEAMNKAFNQRPKKFVRRFFFSDRGGIRTLPSGAKYRMLESGWLRINPRPSTAPIKTEAQHT